MQGRGMHRTGHALIHPCHIDLLEVGRVQHETGRLGHHEVTHSGLLVRQLLLLLLIVLLLEPPVHQDPLDTAD